ncbi:MAG: superoxide dismutase, Ni [Kiritimatiellales bacterium]|nr:superoxide dismutase, Ni [Kiritimatiellales bacterium]
MQRRTAMAAIVVVCIMAIGTNVFAHCQIPCGIYDDATRVILLKEHVTTIEKSMKQIQASPDMNQAVRWVNNKDEHADALSEIVTYYFMAQRIKPVDPKDKAAQAKYVKNLTLLHGMLVESMKAKQTVDLEHVENLKELIHQFEHSYMGLKD